MATFFITLTVLLLVVAGMAIGVILQNKPIKGSCGGMSALGIDTECDICGGDTKKCETEQKRQKASANANMETTSQAEQTSLESKELAYDASEKSNS